MDASDEHYMSHLTEVNQHNKVTLSEDMYNNSGALVVKKGAEVTPELARKVARHKLMKPLQESIEVSSSLTHKTIVKIYGESLVKLKIMDIVKHSRYFTDTVGAFKLLLEFPLIIQKLTVLGNRMPEILEKSLVTSGFCVGLCKELELSKDTTQHVFLANMMSDIGLLHIDPKVVFKKGQYTPDEWQMMQGHVVIAKHFADQVPNLPKPVGRALLEHHERCDGLGYPFAKKAEDLGIEGQVIAMTDKASALVQKLIKKGPYSWKAVIDVMQIPSTAHDSKVQSAVMRLLKQVSFPYKPAFSVAEYKTLANECLKKRARLKLWFTEFAKIYVDHKDKMADSESFQPFSLLKQLEHTIHDTGLVSDAQHNWLQSLPDSLSKEECLEVEEFSLVLTEIEYQCFFVLRLFASAKDEFAYRFGSDDLPLMYYEGLNNILTSD